MACSAGDSGLANALPSHLHLPRKNLNVSSSAAGLGAAGGVAGAAAVATGLAAEAAAGAGAAGFGCALAETAIAPSETNRAAWRMPVFICGLPFEFRLAHDISERRGLRRMSARAVAASSVLLG